MSGRFYQDIHAWCPACGGREIFTSTSRAGQSGGGDTIDAMHELSCPEARDCEACGAEVHPAGFVSHHGDCAAMWTDTDDEDEPVRPSHLPEGW